jgi:hypothetical protein
MTMSVRMTSFLKKTLLADAIVTGAAAVLMAAGASLLGPFLDIPGGLLFWAGIVLVPFVGLLVAMARRESAPRLVLFDIVLINALWVAASFGIIIVGLVEPSLLGTLFISAQALAVALFAALQASALKAAQAAVA